MANASTKRMNGRMRTRLAPLAVGLTLASVTLSVTTNAQTLSSGSDGSDGPLTVATNQGTILFDPTDFTRWGRVLDADGDGVYNFTTIQIGSGTIVRLRGDIVNRPVYWLASGNVVIDGTLDLSGASGLSTSDLSLRRQVAVPGPGGYAGGAGGVVGLAPNTPGEGPGGGTGGGGQCGTGVICGKGGTFTGNRYLIPLVGGSGGEGSLWSDGVFRGGGAGGGAILIASSTSIALIGSIAAVGGSGQHFTGNSYFNGGGSGGAIRLVAPNLTGSGHLDVRGGNGGTGAGTPGWVRLESFQGGGSFVFEAGGAFVTRGSPVDQLSLRPSSSLRVTSIAGVNVPSNPTGSFSLPDVTISTNTPVNVEIQATGIPPGTVVTLQVFPQSPVDIQMINFPTAQATLGGTLQLSTATTTFTFPYGFSRGYIRATWSQ